MSGVMLARQLGAGTLLVIGAIVITVTGLSATAGVEAATNESVSYSDTRENVSGAFVQVRENVSSNLTQNRATNLAGGSVALMTIDTAEYFAMAGVYMGYQYPAYSRWYVQWCRVGVLSCLAAALQIQYRDAKEAIE